MSLLEMRQDKAGMVKEMRLLVAKAEDEKRNLSEEENRQFSELDQKVKDIDGKIEREERLELLERAVENVPDRIAFEEGKRKSEEDKLEFNNLGEFFFTLRNNPMDVRLRKYRCNLPQEEGEKRASQQMGTGVLGGVMIPKQLSKAILSVSPQEEIIKPRATVIPAGDPPDAKMSFPTLDQTSAENMYGGVVVYHKGELQAATETDLRFKEVTLEPKKSMGLIRSSNDLLRNWDAASAFIQTQLRLARMGSDDYDFLRGDGANKAMGILNLDARINYTRATANQISFADVSGMYARARFGGQLIWIASQTTIPQLVNIRDSGDNNLWVQAASQSVPPTLYGFPVFWDERSPTLGTAGDLVLCDLKYYLIKEGSGPIVDMSTDYYFNTDEIGFRVVWNVDGNGWLSEAIPLEGDTSNTVSPFVVLN